MGRWYRNFGSYFRGPYRIRNGRRQGMLGRGIRKYAGGFHKKITIPTAKAIMAKNWNTEKKYIETSNGSLSMTNTSWATPVCLNQVPQGLSSLNRIGMQYRMNRLQVRFLVRANGNAAVAHRIRLVIFQVPQADLDDTTGVPITPVPQHGELDICIMDFPRTVEGYVSYSAIEEIKNGMFFNGKFESSMVMFNTPHIVIFANFLPDTSKLSKDRWVIENISNTEGYH